MRGWTGNLVLLSVSCVLAFVLCEVVIRRLPASDAMGWTMVQPVPERVAAAGGKQGGIPRIMVLGDSFTEWRDNSGESFPRVAARQLARSGKPVDVVNLGEAGTGLSDYMGNLLRHGPTLGPDVVVIGLYLGNDLVPSSPSLDTPEGEAAVRAAPDRMGEGPAWRRWLKKSVALNYVYRLGKLYIPALRSGFFESTLAYAAGQAGLDGPALSARLERVAPDLLEAARADAINGWDVAMAMAEPDYYDDLARLNPGSAMAARVAGSLRDLRALVARARSMGAEVVVVLLPPPVWVSERYRRHFTRLGYGRLGPADGELPLLARLKAELAALAVTTVDPLPALRASPDDTYLPRDIHPDRLGQQLIGQELAARLMEMPVVARPAPLSTP